jgi:hypothetical protein
MSVNLNLGMALVSREVSTLEGPVLQFTLSNRGDSCLTIPSYHDQSDALALHIFSDEGDLFRRVDGLAQQAMLSAAAVDTEPMLQDLEPGESWSWDLNLLAAHSPLPAGHYQIEATYSYPAENVDLKSERSSFEVRAAEISSAAFLRDNPVLDGLTLALCEGKGRASRHHLRLHNAGRPLAAWYAASVAQRPHMENFFCAQASFYQTESFDPFFRRWAVWQEGPLVFAHAFDEGAPEADSLHIARIPAGHRLIRFAHATAADQLYVFFIDHKQRLVARLFEEQRLRDVFIHYLPDHLELDPVLGADETGLRIALFHRGLSYTKLDHQGDVLDSMKPYNSRLRCSSARYEAETDQFKAVFRERGKGKSVEMLVTDCATASVESLALGPLPLRGELHELAFDRDLQGHFHLLASTSRRQLYHLTPGRGPLRIAQGEDSFFPCVCASTDVFLGYFRKDRGYRFLQRNVDSAGPNINNHETDGHRA